MIQNDSITKGECLSSASLYTATVIPNNYTEFQTEQQGRMTSPGVSGCEWVVKILCYSVAIPRCSCQSKQTWKARAYKHFQMFVLYRIKHAGYHLSSIIFMKLKKIKTKTLKQMCCEPNYVQKLLHYCGQRKIYSRLVEHL